MTTRQWRAIAATLALAAIGPATQAQARADDLVRYRVRPSATDSMLRRFDEPHLVVFDRAVKREAPLLLFMPGTGGRPLNTSEFLELAARQGYRAIGLEYVDTPAVGQICPRERDPRCSEMVRAKRIFGDDDTPLIDDRAHESIVARLVALLRTLHRDHPAEGWDAYLADGRPNWPRIAVSGLSQGAGMAAYIAQRTTVARVVLFSSPWDSYGPRRTLAPWITRGTGATAPDRWFAAYHEREPTADQIARAYAALGIPRGQVRVFTLEPADRGSVAPYHPSVVANAATPRAADGSPAYLDQWRFLLGDALSRESPTMNQDDARDGPRAGTAQVAIAAGSGREVQAMIARAPDAASLRIDRDTITLRVGATVSFSDLPIVLLDSAGQVMGRLPLYDVMVPPNPILRRAGMAVQGVAAGSQELTFRIPSLFRKGATTASPAVRVVFVVTE